MSSVMPPDYLALAMARSATEWSPYLQPEDFGYDFREWVSPYTKGAHHIGGVALVLQDWASEEGLRKAHDPAIQAIGRSVKRRTNQVLECVLGRVFGLSIAQVYATNAFPFVKPNGMSSHIRKTDVQRSVEQFTRQELKLARPTQVISLGAAAFDSLQAAGIPSIKVPHPAARIGSIDAHESAWRKALGRAPRHDA
jgi:uracil-DNA glycosylase